MPSPRYNRFGHRYGKTHCPRKGVMVEVDPRREGQNLLPSRALVLGPGRRAGHVVVQFRFNAGVNPFEVPCDRLSKAITRRGTKYEPYRYDPSVPARSIEGVRRRKRRRS